MYDMIVYTVIDPQKLNYSAKEIGCIIDNIILCAESEWRPDIYSILYDFQKLLFSRTKIRLMVYQANNNNKVRYSEIMKDIIKNSKSCRDDDIFVFAVYDSTEDNGTLDITRFTVNDLKISKTTK
jgi:hypothetical protein